MMKRLRDYVAALVVLLAAWYVMCSVMLMAGCPWPDKPACFNWIRR